MASNPNIKKMVRFADVGVNGSLVGQILNTNNNDGWHCVKLLDKHGHLEYATVNPALVIEEWEEGAK